MRFGPSEIPACRANLPGCAIADADSASMKALKIEFNLWQLLSSRNLDLKITLVQPQLFLDQNAEGQWLITKTQKKDSPSWLKIRLDQLHWQAGEVRLQPWKVPSRHLTQFEGNLDVTDLKNLNFGAQGQIDSGGQITVSGDWQNTERRLTLKGNAQDLRAAPLMGFLPQLPFNVYQGRLQGDFQIQYQPQHPLGINLDATLANADLWIPKQAIRVRSKAIKADVQLQSQPGQPLGIKGDAWLSTSQADIPEDLILKNNRQRSQRLTQLRGTLNF
ncbi:MAG: DUF748 domain-containing protein [Acaryochloridaceae cyanobacterium SU_2_1]|nr:DUF748 domain-containing protein [Acaryochloridaceae cyanobacterium SU_2_1]